MNKANAMTALFLVASTCLIASVGFSQSEYYDKFAYIKSPPTAPAAPKSISECDKYEDRVDKFVSSVGEAHDSCLRIETSSNIGNVVSDSLNKCSNAKCQALHDARLKQREEAETKKAQCRATVAKVETMQQRCTPAQDRSCANRCDDEWGMLCPFTTVCDPIKHRCEKAKP